MFLLRLTIPIILLKSVPEYWEWLIHQGEQGRIKIRVEVIEEIEAGNDADPFCAWVKNGAAAEALTLDEQVHTSVSGWFVTGMTIQEAPKSPHPGCLPNTWGVMLRSICTEPCS